MQTENVEYLAKKIAGEIRIRSNVCQTQHEWHLVPGDVLKAYGITLLNGPTPKQKEEMARYEPCCLCHRTIYEIREDGCDHYTCRQQGLPSTEQAARRRDLRMRREESRQ